MTLVLERSQRRPEAVQGSRSAVVDPLAHYAFERDTDPEAADLARAWDDLEGRCVASPYQTRAWIAAWTRHVAGHARVQPAIVTARRNGRVVFILPLARRNRGPVRLLTWLGDSHTNFHMGLYDRDWLTTTQPSERLAAVEAAVAAAGPADVLELCCQPREWAGHANPFASLPSFPSTNSGWQTPLTAHIGPLLSGASGARRRKKRRWQRNRLTGIGWTVERVDGGADCDAFLTRSFDAMNHRFARAGIWNRFADAGVEDHFRHLCAQVEGAVRLYALTIDGTPCATLAVVTRARHASGCFIARSRTRWDWLSPGHLLLHEAIADLCRDGFASFDLGKGRESYKLAWCPQEIATFDTCIALTPWAAIFPLYERTKIFAKRMVRNDPRLWRLAKRVRSAFYGRL